MGTYEESDVVITLILRCRTAALCTHFEVGSTGALNSSYVFLLPDAEKGGHNEDQL